ncbi:MAG: hypothetical protein IPN92_16670 [Chromatiaceae bacterium]|nr:hypothetical protein [Chromatiaceae bacterium]
MLILLCTHTGHDFSLYKKPSLYRRIERRMALVEVRADAVTALLARGGACPSPGRHPLHQWPYRQVSGAPQRPAQLEHLCHGPGGIDAAARRGRRGCPLPEKARPLSFRGPLDANNHEKQ